MPVLMGLNGCCGIGEYHGIQNDEVKVNAALIRDALRQAYSDRKGFIIFSSASSNSAERLAACIKRLKKGTVVSAGEGVNPNTGNRLKVYLWKLPRSV